MLDVGLERQNNFNLRATLVSVSSVHLFSSHKQHTYLLTLTFLSFLLLELWKSKSKKKHFKKKSKKKRKREKKKKVLAWKWAAEYMKLQSVFLFFTELEQWLLQKRGKSFNGFKLEMNLLGFYASYLRVSFFFFCLFTDWSLQKGPWKKPCEIVNLPRRVCIRVMKAHVHTHKCT